jgi:hypothetical protein
VTWQAVKTGEIPAEIHLINMLFMDREPEKPLVEKVKFGNLHKKTAKL